MVEKKAKEVTSIKVDPELWKEAKIQAIREGIALNQLLDEALEMRLKREAKMEVLSKKHEKEAKQG
jgi:predicted HicB family RNase H-like nuclease